MALITTGMVSPPMAIRRSKLPFSCLFAFLFLKLSMGYAQGLNVVLQTIVERICKDIQATPANRFAEVEAVAIVYFKVFNPKGYENMSEHFSDTLALELSKRKIGRVADRASLREVLKEQSLNTSGFVNEETIQKIGNLLHVQAVVLGDIIAASNKLVVNVRMVKVKTGEIIWANAYKSSLSSRIEYIPWELSQFLWIESCYNAMLKALQKINIRALQSETIAVPDISSQGKNFGIEEVITSFLVVELVKRGVKVVERAKLEYVLNELSLSLSGILSEENKSKVGDLLGVTALALGSITVEQQGELFNIYGERTKVRVSSHVHLKFVSIKSGEILQGASGEDTFKI